MNEIQAIRRNNQIRLIELIKKTAKEIDILQANVDKQRKELEGLRESNT